MTRTKANYLYHIIIRRYAVHKYTISCPPYCVSAIFVFLIIRSSEDTGINIVYSRIYLSLPVLDVVIHYYVYVVMTSVHDSCTY